MTNMKKTIRLHHLLLKLALASILISGWNSHAQAQTLLSEKSQTILISQTSAEDFAKQGFSLASQERYQEAIASYDKAIQLKPDFTDAIKARQLAQESLRSATPIQTAKQAQQPEQSQFSNQAQGRAAVFSTQGQSLYTQKRYKEAVASFDKAIQLDPDFYGVVAWGMRGVALAELTRYQEVVISMDKFTASFDKLTKRYPQASALLLPEQ
jgi:tetratricopeptide (TPR) repeat protein